MPQTVNTNIASLNAQRNLNKSQGALQTSLERLSSGLRINSAKDDAAGLAISNRFTTQVRGLNVAMRNANDGISFAQTTEGALGEVTTALQRIRDLAVQSANDTNSDSDRQSLQAEVDQLVSEINRIAETTTFNGTKVLNGSKDRLNFQIGANANQTVSVEGMDARASALGSQPGVVQSTGDRVAIVAGGGEAGTKGIQEDAGGAGADDITDLSIRLSSVNSGDEVNLADARFGGNISSVSTDDLQDRFNTNYGSGLAKTMAERINTARDSGEASMQGVYASAVTTFRGSDIANGDTGATVDANVSSTVGVGELKNGDLVINGVDIGAVKFEANDASGALTNAINAKSDVTGVQASVDKNGELVLTAKDGRDIVLDTSSGAVTNDLFGGGDEAATTRFSDTGFTDLRVSGRLTVTGTDTINFGGANADVVSLDAAGLAAEGSEENVQAVGTIANADITTVSAANLTISSVDSALSQVDSFRATLGAVQNRLDSTIRNLASVSESLSAANSRILDADFASETANLSKNQVLQQAGISVLAQANALPQSALSLLG